MLSVRKTDPRRPEVAALIAELDAPMHALYPAESNHLDDASELSKAYVHFIGVYLDEVLIGIGAVKKLNGYGELKRMYVKPEARGTGAAAAILEALQQHARSSGLPKMCLETGIHQHAAIAFYRKHGFVQCGPFGDYGPDPLSVFMEKQL